MPWFFFLFLNGNSIFLPFSRCERWKKEGWRGPKSDFPRSWTAIAGLLTKLSIHIMDISTAAFLQLKLYKQKNNWDEHEIKKKCFLLFQMSGALWCISFIPTAGASLRVPEGECPAVQGALQDGAGVPQGWVWDRSTRGAKVSPSPAPWAEGLARAVWPRLPEPCSGS